MNNLLPLALLSLASLHRGNDANPSSDSHNIPADSKRANGFSTPTGTNFPYNVMEPTGPTAPTPANPINMTVYTGALGATPYVIYDDLEDMTGTTDYTGPAFSEAFITAMGTLGIKDSSGRFVLPPLGYDYAAMEPYIDEKTMQIHHNKHHQKYITTLNTALSKHPELFNYSLEQLLTNSNSIPEDIRATVTDNAGGNYAHSLFWKTLSPDQNQEPSPALNGVITRDFGSFADWQSLFKQIALTTFGSGWAWLLADPNGKLLIATTANQNTPLPLGLRPLLLLDLWEHAYYLKYQNLRDEYIDNWFNLINWAKVEDLYTISRRRRHMPSK